LAPFRQKIITALTLSVVSTDSLWNVPEVSVKSKAVVRGESSSDWAAFCKCCVAGQFNEIHIKTAN